MIYGDYHTHTVYSHGKGSVEENAARAAAIGLKELAVTDHGFKHVTYNVRRMDLPFLIRDKQAAAEKYPNLEIMLGVEANLMDGKGTVDLTEYDLDKLDLIVCGYHKYVRNSLSAFFGFAMPIFMSGLVRKSSQNRIAANTDAFVKAIERYPIDIISHPGFGIKIDFRELARAAAHYGTFLEINGKRISFSAHDAEAMLDEGARFVVNSDAHSPSRVGEVDLPLKFIKESGLSFEHIANWDKQPVFRRKRQLCQT